MCFDSISAKDNLVALSGAVKQAFSCTLFRSMFSENTLIRTERERKVEPARLLMKMRSLVWQCTHTDICQIFQMFIQFHLSDGFNEFSLDCLTTRREYSLICFLVKFHIHTTLNLLSFLSSMLIYNTESSVHPEAVGKKFRFLLHKKR